MIQTRTHSISSEPVANAIQEVAVVCCADDRYAMSLAVTLASAAMHLSPRSRLRVYLVDGGISSAKMDKIRQTADAHRIELESIHFDGTVLNRFPVSHHISKTAYFRLLLDELLPQNLARVIYLDSDLLIRADLTDLWEHPLNDKVLLAVPDVACPFIDAVQQPDRLSGAGPYMAAWKPIRNYESLGIVGSGLYFNSGLLVVDLDRWRNESVSSALMQCMHENKKHVWCWDQYALNAVLHDRWHPLPISWNLGAHAYEYPSDNHSPFGNSELREAIGTPKIVHFTTKHKPWHFESKHPHRDEFFQIVDKTSWNGWRPEPPKKSLVRWWLKNSEKIQKRLTVSYRKLVVRSVEKRRGAK